MLTADRLREVLDYDAGSGVFTRRTSGGGRRAGDIAGGASYDGYTTISVDGTRYRAARLAWLWMTGAWPACDVDHIDRDRRNDAWSNLRAASRSENCANQPARSGLKGASFVSAKGKWKAQIRKSGKNTHIGYFDSEADAHAAYMAAAVTAFGEFAGC